MEFILRTKGEKKICYKFKSTWLSTGEFGVLIIISWILGKAKPALHLKPITGGNASLGRG